MTLPAAAFTRQKVAVDFHSLRHASPQGVYTAPVPDKPLLWTGVMFLRKEGPYANAILRFEIEFPETYPNRAPIIRFLSDVFHPLVTPLTTYTYTTRDPGTDTVSAADDDRLPPGGYSLRHGFPEWFHEQNGPGKHTASQQFARSQEAAYAAPRSEASSIQSDRFRAPHIVEVLQYLRIAFDTEAVLDSVPLEAAANPGAWHAWRSFRSKQSKGHSRSSSIARQDAASDGSSERSLSPRQHQQPGGARRPGEWNWQGVWEDRVRKSIQASTSDPVLFGGDNSEVINFLKIAPEDVASQLPGRDTSV